MSEQQNVIVPDDVLREVLELAANAMPGPWHQGPYYRSDVHSTAGTVAECGTMRGPQAVKNAAFIAHAGIHYAAVCRELLERRAKGTPAPAGAGEAKHPQPGGNAPPGPDHTAALVRRLRDDEWRFCLWPLSRAALEVWHKTCCEAADEIERLAARVVELERRLMAECCRRFRIARYRDACIEYGWCYSFFDHFELHWDSGVHELWRAELSIDGTRKCEAALAAAEEKTDAE